MAVRGALACPSRRVGVGEPRLTTACTAQSSVHENRDTGTTRGSIESTVDVDLDVDLDVEGPDVEGRGGYPEMRDSPSKSNEVPVLELPSTVRNTST